MKSEERNHAAQPVSVDAMINKLVNRASTAAEAYMQMNQEQIDTIVKSMAVAAMDNHMALAKAAVEETKRGVYEDKITKNMFAAEYIYHDIKHQKTVGVINENKLEGYVEIAEPVGIIAGITPVTNPTSTTIFKSLIAAKTRNPIIFAFHPSAQKSSSMAAQVLLKAAIEAGAPKYCIQWIEEPSLEATTALINHPGISLILATGGSNMVKAAYSAGKPALGVGPGNVPCYIDQSAELETALTDLMLSKTFDNGMICASEQSVIFHKAIADRAIEFLKSHNCYVLNKNEVELLIAVAMNKEKGGVNPAIVGQSAVTIAKMAGLEVPENTRILIAPLDGIGSQYPLSGEKLSPILALYIAKDYKEAIEMAKQLISYGGIGHSAAIHSKDKEVIKEFSKTLKVSRIVVNAPSSHGAIGDIYNSLIPSLTLGCGTYGGNSTSDNVSSVNLINVKRVAARRYNMQWFKVPEKIYFEPGAIGYLEKMPDISRAFIVTDAAMVKLGYTDRILYYLRKHSPYVHSEIFADVEPDPSVDTIIRGVELMNSFQPDVIIALGGGSAIDAAKGMWLYYEHPEVDFANLKLKFMDIRKRVYKFPRLGNKAKLVAIPTTSGTGSEVTSFAVITDKEKGVKYPLADYELTPDVAIIDPDLVMTVPPTITADTGMDVLTHAIEAYVSVMASDYTDALAIKAIQLVFEYLPRAYKNGNDSEAREKMHNASCMAGMAFTNAFLGINHSLAHKLGGEFHIPHGRANAVLLPYVIEYNAKEPEKLASFPKYGKFVADKRYAEIARMLGLPASTVQEGVNSLIKAIRDLMTALNMPHTIAQCGVSREEFEAKVNELAEKAFEDQCTTANPKLPLIRDLVDIYMKAYNG